MFNWISNIIRWLFYGNINVALLASILAFTQLQDVKITTSLPYLLVLFFGTLLIYLLDRMMLVATGYTDNLTNWTKSHFKSAFSLFIIATIPFLISLFFISLKGLILLIPIAILSLSYSIETNFTKPTRKNPHLKTLTIALCWALLTIYWPIVSLQNSSFYDHSLLLKTVYFTCLAYAITLPFDVFDLLEDNRNNTKTLVYLKGIKKSNTIALGFAFVSLILPLLNFDILGYNYVLTSIIALMFIKISENWKSKLFHLILLDGVFWIFILLSFVFK